MYERIAGIQPLKPGYETIKVAPIPGGGLTSAKANYESPFGTIVSAWSIEGDVFTLETSIPSNTRALIRLPEKLFR